ncbi:tetratricopeptide repeat protein [Algibacter amylolyticus]|nr:hypothetical protein [Algibacter amylolyticus]
MKIKSFFNQCQEKEVFKMLSIYIVSAWIILQVLSITWQPLGLPEKSVTILIVILLLCFPLYIFFLWKFKILPVLKSEIDTELNEEKITNKAAFKKTYFSFLAGITSLCAIAVFLIINKNFTQENNEPLPEIVSSNKIAVLKFGNNTGDSQYDIVSKMASDWIIHGITENRVAQVITQDLIDEYKTSLKGKSTAQDESVLIKKYLKPSKIISGNFYLQNGKMLFKAMITDGITNKTLISFKPSECSKNNPIQCIEDLNESVIGYFITEDKKGLMLQKTPPKYDAYKYLLEAKYSNNNQEYINLLNNAIAADSDYFEPKVLRVGHYYNIKEFKKSDSLLKLIKPDSYTNKRQLNLLNMYEALLKGDNRTVYKTIIEEYKIAPFDLKTNRTAMVVALQYVNRPEDVSEMFKAINMDSMNLKNCSDCVQRIYVNAFSDIELGKNTIAIQSIEKAQKEDQAKLLNKPLVIAYVRANKTEALNAFLRKIKITSTPAETQELYLQAGKEYLLKDEKTKAHEYFDKIINAPKETLDSKMLANALFYKEAFTETKTVLKELHKINPKDIDILTKLAICNFKQANQNEANKNISAIKNLRANYQFGEVDYALAQYYASIDKTPELYNYLLKAAANGHSYHWKYFKNDPQFKKYNKTKEFEEVMNFWK